MTQEPKHPTSGGVELTAEFLEELADEAERGYEPEQLKRRRGRPPVGSDAGAPFQVRLEPELREALNDRARASQTTPSSVARGAISRYLEPAPSRIPLGSGLANPELVDAEDLDQYARRREAEELLPRLVRMLLMATTQVTRLSARAGTGIRVPGADAHVEAIAGHPFVPEGPSLWEFGVSERCRDKAQRDYLKRTKEADPEVAAATTFVSVTMRRWGREGRDDGKESWVTARRGQGRWRNVVALDADDLEAWLTSQPQVHVWLSERMGRRPAGVQTLELWYESWSSQQTRPLPPMFLLAGRFNESRQLLEALRREPEPVGLKAGSRSEAIAFLACTLSQTEQGSEQLVSPLSRALVVSSAEAWATLVVGTGGRVLVPAFESPDVGLAIRSGHHVVVPLGESDDDRRAKISLPRVSRDEAREALVAQGWSFEEADRVAAHARRSLLSLLRELAVSPAVAHPSWSDGPSARVLAPLLLVGRWSDRVEADREIVAELVGKPYSELERDLAEWARSDDPPLRRSGGTWMFASTLDAWNLLRKSITSHDLKRWHNLAFRVLSERNPVLGLPEEERLLAGVRGVKMAWSSDIRRGIAQAIAVMGSSEDRTLGQGRSDSEQAANLVHRVFEVANSDATGLVWQSLSDVLPLLAEGSPRQFLEAVDEGLRDIPPRLLNMFTDKEDRTGLGVSSPHAGLLWALESLCWSERHLGPAADALAALADIDPGAKLSNRPAASLRTIFLPWMPNTSATLTARLSVLDGLLARRRSVAWRLLLALLPQPHDVAFPSHAPAFRDWKPDQIGVTIGEHKQAVHELMNRVLDQLAERPSQWVDVIAHLDDLPTDELNRCLNQLEQTQPAAFEDSRFNVWKSVAELAAKHRQFPDAQWVLPEEFLCRLEAIAGRLEPQEEPQRHSRLFDWHPDLPGTNKFNHVAYDASLHDARVAAVSEVHSRAGLKGLIRLSAAARLPRLVGATLAAIRTADDADEVIPYVASQGPEHELAVGWLTQLAQHADLLSALKQTSAFRGLPEPSRADFYLACPNTPDTWAAVGNESASVQDRYWQSVSGIGVQPDDVDAFADLLLDHGRPWSAIDLLAMHSHRPGETGLNAVTVERALRAALDPDTDETPRPGAFDYDLGVLLDLLANVGAPDDTQFELEWAYFPVLEHTRAPRAISARLAANPDLFVEAVSLVFRGDGEERQELDARQAAMAQNCYALLRSWRRVPGLHDDGTIDSTHLRDWVTAARAGLAAAKRSTIGDVCIGEVLSGAPLGTDDVWPAEAVREIIEAVRSKKLEEGLFVGRLNARGVTSRGVYEGGQQERALADQYRSWAERVQSRWWRTGQLLHGLADSYLADARREDASAERMADEG